MPMPPYWLPLAVIFAILGVVFFPRFIFGLCGDDEWFSDTWGRCLFDWFMGGVVGALIGFCLSLFVALTQF